MDFEILIPIAFFFSIVAIIKIVSDNKVRQRLIEKGQVDEKVKFLYEQNPRLQTLSNLKWGMVLVGIGLGFLINTFLPGINDGAAAGIVLIFAGAGFLIYFGVAKKYLDSLPEEVQQQ